jgi:hypothetical protein
MMLYGTKLGNTNFKTTERFKFAKDASEERMF